jgi:hypothetical protein
MLPNHVQAPKPPGPNHPRVLAFAERVWTPPLPPPTDAPRLTATKPQAKARATHHGSQPPPTACCHAAPPRSPPAASER